MGADGLHELGRWVAGNKEWLFSGAGIVVILGVLRWIVGRQNAKQGTAAAVIVSPSGGTNIAAGGSIGTVHVAGPSAVESATAQMDVRYAALEKQLGLVVALETNVELSLRHLRELIATVDHWSSTGHKRLEEARQEFLELRPQLGALHRADIVDYVGRWYEQIVDVCAWMENEYSGWITYLNLGGMSAESPPVKHVMRYRQALNYGGGVRNSVAELRKRVEEELHRFP